MKAKKINIFALPNQTAVLFWLIAVTLVGSTIFGTIGISPFPIRWIAPAVILISIWGFLSHSDRDLRKGKLTVYKHGYPLLSRAIRDLSIRIGLKKTPAILLSNEQRKMNIAGSFRRWYIIFGKDDVQMLEDLLGDPRNSDLAEMKILHELYHFRNGDYWQLGLLTEMFKTSFSVMVWFMCFFGGWMLILALAAQSFVDFSPSSVLEKMPPDLRPMVEQIFSSAFPSASELDALQSKVAEINFVDAASFVFNISLPFIFIAAILWLFYLPLFWQMREFYADAGMVQTLGTSKPIWKTLPNTRSGIESTQPEKIDAFHAFRRTTTEILSRFQELKLAGRRFSPIGRTDALLDPQRVFYSWKKIALYLGGLTLVLEVFLSTPLTLPIVGQNPMYFSILVILVATAYFLLPKVIFGSLKWLDALLIIVIINLVRLIWLAITLAILWTLYFLAPNTLFEVLRSAIYSTARYVGNTAFELNMWEFLTKASLTNLLQVPIIFTVQILSLTGLLYLFRRISTWYSAFSTSTAFKRTVLVLIAGEAIILSFSILPPISALLLGNANSLMRAGTIFQLFLGLSILVGGIVWFVIQDRRCSYLCPTCNTKTTYSGSLNENCQSCGNPVFPWLWTEYQDE